LLTEARFAIFTLSAMNERGGFRIETMEAIGMFIYKGVVLRHKLPSNLRRNDVVMNIVRRSIGIRHYGSGC